MRSEDKNRQSRRNTGNTPLADPTVFLKNNENGKGTPINNTSQHRKPCSSKRLEKFVESSGKDRANGMSCVRERFLKEGLSNESSNIIMASWGESTSIKYQVYIKQWLDFCKNHNINYQNASVSNGLHFLTYLYQSGKQYPTISCARSILSLFIRSSNGLEFGKESIVQRFMKGIYQLRPSLPKYSFTWDVSILIGKYQELPPNDQLDLKALTLKTATLLTLMLCQRTQTIFTPNLRYIKKDRDTIHIAFPSVLKHSRPGRHLKPVILKRCLADTKICPVEALDTYLKATKQNFIIVNALMIKLYKILL